MNSWLLRSGLITIGVGVVAACLADCRRSAPPPPPDSDLSMIATWTVLPHDPDEGLSSYRYWFGADYQRTHYMPGHRLWCWAEMSDANRTLQTWQGVQRMPCGMSGTITVKYRLQSGVPSLEVIVDPDVAGVSERFEFRPDTWPGKTSNTTTGVHFGGIAPENVYPLITFDNGHQQQIVVKVRFATGE